MLLFSTLLLAAVFGVAAVAKLAGFSAAIVFTLARGRRPSCHCFGRLQAAEVGWSTVARNGLLASIAGFVAADGRFPIVFAALAAIAMGAWLCVELRAPRALRAGATAPGFSLPDQAGRPWTVEALVAGRRPLLLVFSDPTCGACRELMADVAGWQRGPDRHLAVAVVSAGSREEHAVTARDHGVSNLLLDADHRVAAAYGVSATPSAVLIDGERRVAAAPAVGAEEIAGLVARVVDGGEDAMFARRGLLRTAAVGVAGVTVVPFLASAVATARSVQRAVRPKQLKIDGAWLCDQRYALCTSARCEPSRSNPKIAICRCKIATGYSVGFKTCPQRAARGNQLHSNFSLQETNSRTRVMTCAARGLWVQCLDVKCRVDPRNPRRALCECVKMRTRNFSTFGGNCDTDTCSSVIWSATTSPFPGGAQYEKGLKQLGIPVRMPRACSRSSRRS